MTSASFLHGPLGTDAPSTARLAMPKDLSADLPSDSDRKEEPGGRVSPLPGSQGKKVPEEDHTMPGICPRPTLLTHAKLPNPLASGEAGSLATGPGRAAAEGAPGAGVPGQGPSETSSGLVSALHLPLLNTAQLIPDYKPEAPQHDTHACFPQLPGRYAATLQSAVAAAPSVSHGPLPCKLGFIESQ